MCRRLGRRRPRRMHRVRGARPRWVTRGRGIHRGGRRDHDCGDRESSARNAVRSPREATVRDSAPKSRVTPRADRAGAGRTRTRSRTQRARCDTVNRAIWLASPRSPRSIRSEHARRDDRGMTERRQVAKMHVRTVLRRKRHDGHHDDSRRGAESVSSRKPAVVEPPGPTVVRVATARNARNTTMTSDVLDTGYGRESASHVERRRSRVSRCR